MSELNEDVLGALRTLDDDWDLEAARASVRNRVAELAATAAGARVLRAPTAAGTRGSKGAVWSLSRAAGILLVTAAAAYALPGSPVRRWVQGGANPTLPTPEAPATTLAQPEADPVAGGIRLSVPGGALRVVLRDVAPGTEIRVTLVPGTEAAVYAPEGSRFTSAAGRVEARVVPGDVRVELPRGVDPVSLEVGGRVYLRGTDAGLDVSGPVLTRDDAEIVFLVPRD